MMSTTMTATRARSARAPKFANVVVPSGATGPELVRARRIAQERGAELTFAGVDELLEYDRYGDDRVEVLPSLVVVGASRNYFGRLLAERVHASVRCPVLQVRNSGFERYSCVVLAMDVDAALDEMVAAARFVERGAPLLFLHAYGNPFESMLYLNGADSAAINHHRRESADACRELMRAQMKRWNFGEERLRLQHGAPRFVLRRVPRRALLVVQRGQSRLKHVFFGSVTRWVLQEGGCDVLVV